MTTLLKKINPLEVFIFTFVLSMVVGILAYASSTSQFSQTINAGTLAADIKDASRVTVANPSITMSSKTVSFDCQSGGSASTGVFGTNTERIYVSNPNAADNGWTLTLAANGGTTATWSDGGTGFFDFNDANGSGCTDGADADLFGGQMTVDTATNGVLTADCGNCTVNNITKGAAASYSEGVTDSVTLLTAAAASDNVGRWYLTAVDVSQTIPAEQTSGTYTLSMSLTATAS